MELLNRRVISYILFLCLWPVLTHAQSTQIAAIRPLTVGPVTLTSIASACIPTNSPPTIAALDIGGYSGVSVEVTGTWTGTLRFEMSTRGTVFQPVQLVTAAGTTSGTTTTVNGLFMGGAIGKYLCVRASALTGSAIVMLRATTGGVVALGDVSFSGTIGTVDQGFAGGQAWKVDASDTTQPVSGTVSVTGTTTVAGDVGVTGTVAVSAVSGSVTVAQATGTNLHVVCDSGCASSGGTSQLDRATFTFGTTPETPVGGVYNSSITALTSGQTGALALTTARKVHTALFDAADNALTSLAAGAERAITVAVVDSSGNQVSAFGGSGGTAQNDNTAFTYGTTAQTPVGCVYNSAITAITSGRAGALGCTTARKLHTALFDSADNAITSIAAGGTRPLTVAVLDSGGNQISSFGGSGGTSQNDNTTFTYGTTAQTPIGCVYNSSITAITAGRAGSVGCTTARKLHTALFDASDNALTSIAAGAQRSITVAVVDSGGNQISSFGGSGGISQNDNTTFTYGTTGVTPVGCVFANSPTAITSGRAAAIGCNTNREIFVAPHAVTNAGTFAVQSVDQGNVASGATDSGNPVKVGGKYNSTPITLTNGQRGDLQMDATGYVKVQVASVAGSAPVLDPCQGNTKLFKPISQITNTQLVTGTSAKKLYICSLLVNTGDVENISFVEGTGSVCATSTLAVIGGTSAATGNNLSANGGYTLGNGAAAVAATAVNANNLCLFQSGTGLIAGVMTYVVQ